MIVKFDNTIRVLNNYGELFRQVYRENNAAAGYDPENPLMNDVTFTVNTRAGVFEIAFSLPNYWKYAEEGRGPGKMPPPGSLTKWMEWKRILPHPMQLQNGRTVLPSMKSLEYLIRRKIGEHGTQGSHTWKMTEDELRDRLISDVKSALYKDFTESIEKSVDAAANKPKN
jgi:hypothetical protein